MTGASTIAFVAGVAILPPTIAELLSGRFGAPDGTTGPGVRAILAVTTLLAAIAGVFALGLGATVRVTLFPWTDSIPGVTRFLVGLALAVGIATPGIETALRFTGAAERTPRERGALVACKVLGLWGVIAVSFGAVAVAGSVGSPAGLLAFPLAAALVVAGYAVVVPWYWTAFFGAREPTDDEWERLAGSISGSDCPPERVTVVDEISGLEYWRPFRRSFGPFATIFVPASSFETFDDVHLQVLLKQFANSSGHAAYRAFGWALYGGGVVALFALVARYGASGTTAIATLAYVFGVPVALVAVGRRLALRADRRVAAEVGTDALVATIERQVEAYDGEIARTPLRHLLMTPAYQERVDRLRDGEAAASD